MSKAAELAALIGSGQAQGNKNLIINGAMTVAQRGTSFSSLSASAYTCDRWQLQVAGAGRGTVTQESSGGPASLKDNFLRVTVATADSSVASSDMQVLKQVIEGHVAAFTDAGTSDAKTLTLSFYVRSSVTGTFSATLYTNFSSPSAVSYPAEYTISSANTWEQKTITFPAFTTSSSLVSSGYTTGEFYQVRFALMAGSGNTGTANQWNSANDFASTNQTNLFATSSATWDITGVQLEIGEVATPFEHEDFGTTLAKCQRYFYRRYVDTADQYLCDAFTTSGTEIVALVQTPVEMRAVPTMAGETLENAAFRYGSGTGALDSFSGTAGTANTYGGSMFITTSGMGGNNSGYMRYHTSPGCGITFDSEL